MLFVKNLNKLAHRQHMRISKSIIGQYFSINNSRLVGNEASINNGSYANANRKRDLTKAIEKSYNKLDLSFENTREAYRSKTNIDLLRGLLVLKLCGLPALVNRNQEIMKLVRKVTGKRLFSFIMRSTFYGHFVAGQNQNEVKPVATKMRHFGVKSIMDYSVEADISEEEAVHKEAKSTEKVLADSDSTPAEKNEETQQTPSSAPISMEEVLDPIDRYKSHLEFGDRRMGVTSARTYFYAGEPECDRNLETFLKCVDAVSHATESTGFTAIKLTALGRPQLLLQLSQVIAQSQQFYKMLTGSSWENLVISKLSEEDFLGRLRDFGIRTDSEAVQNWFSRADFDADGFVDLYEWGRLLDQNIKLGSLFQVVNLVTGKMTPLIPKLTEKEEQEFENMMRRLNTVAQHASDREVRIMIDAEQTYFQPAISRLTLELMRKYNKTKPTVFNTYQCYLRNAMTYVQIDMHLARRESFHFGAKLVRGAYMEQERIRAKTVGYDDPINATFEDTTKMYKDVLSEILNEVETREPGGVSVLVATHNEDTIRFAVEEMKKRGIGPDERIVCFGQLFGMCDQVSFSLGQAGYSVYKYVPYGPVEEVLPYLSRRAQENSAFLSKVQKERRLMWTELKRRLRNGQFFYKVPVNGETDSVGNEKTQVRPVA